MKAGLMTSRHGTIAVRERGKTVYYVSPTGSDSNPGTKALPFLTIGKAITVVTPGTTVIVGSGTYSGSLVNNTAGTAGAPIRFISDVLHGAKIVPGVNAPTESAWDNYAAYVNIVGFEVDGTNYQSGTRWRFGIWTSGTGSVLASNKVHDINRDDEATSAPNGGTGIMGDGYYGGVDFILIGNQIYNIGFPGTSSLIQGIYISINGIVSRNLIYQIASCGVSMWHDPHHVICTNNTIFATDTGILVGSGDYVFEPQPNDYTTVANNIVYDNNYGIAESGPTGVNNTYMNNLCYGNSVYDWFLQNGLTHTGSISANPQFINYQRNGSGDYHLASGSPAINAGTDGRNIGVY